MMGCTWPKKQSDIREGVDLVWVRSTEFVSLSYALTSYCMHTCSSVDIGTDTYCENPLEIVYHLNLILKYCFQHYCKIDM